MINRSLFNCSALIIFLIIFSAFAFAQNTTDALRLATPGLGANARALGMGNSYLSLSDDASAAYFNPAGFGLLKRIEFSGGFSYFNYNDTTALLNNPVKYSNSSTKLNRVSFAFPVPTLRGSMVFGISYHNTQDFVGASKFSAINPTSSLIKNDVTKYNSDVMYKIGLSYPVFRFDPKLGKDVYVKDTTIINGGLQQSGTVLTDGSTNNWTFSGALEVYKNLFIGGNLNIIGGSYKSNTDYYEDDINNVCAGFTDPSEPLTKDFQYFHESRIINWDISGWDAKVGLLYQIFNIARFGLTVQFPKNYVIEETFDLKDEAFFGTENLVSLDPYEYSDRVKYEIITPFELGAGFSLNLLGLIVSADGTLIDYSQLKYDGADGIAPELLEEQNMVIKENFRPVLNVNAGAEFTVPLIGLRFRAGFMYYPSPYKDDPTTFDHKYLTAGVGFLADETFGLDFGLAHGWWEDISDNYESNVSRNFHKVKKNQAMLSATFRF